MARWDEIMTLPVQSPPTLEFSSADIVWSKVEGYRESIDRVALIPFARVDDFVRGESSNKEYPTRFHVEARRRRQPKTPYKQKVDGVLEYILYWCSFGPDDHRKGGVMRPSRTTFVRKNNVGRPNTRRGCTCHFIVKRLVAEPSLALVIYNDDKHVDKKGALCHGPHDKMSAGTRAMYAPCISEDLRLRVLSLLYVGVSVETIMERHNQSVEKRGGPSNRDDLLTHRHVRRQERNVRRTTYEFDADDAVSISVWVETHQSDVFFYEDFSDVNPFTLGIQSEWQLLQMIRFGNRNLLASDSRFGTNKLKYQVHSLLVFNKDNTAIPVAWIVTPKFECLEAYKWMRALYNRVQTKDPTWKLAGFIVDDPLADVLAIRDVFQCSVLISFWRVRHAWHKNLVKRCADNEMRAAISGRLDRTMDNICQQRGTEGLFKDLIEDFLDESDFMDYFKATWYPRIGMWISALQNLPLASQETCAAMEFYHNQLKCRLVNERKPSVYKRVDWLVIKLSTKVHSYFWLDEYSEKDDFARYWKDEWLSGLTSWRKALEIPDSNIVMEGACAKVVDQLDQDKAYVVWNPGSQFGICNCSWAQMGNLCEHILKVITFCRKRLATPSISLLQYRQALIDLLHCPPHDSLIRDHAVSLAALIQKELNVLVNAESRNATMDVASFAGRDREQVNEGPSPRNEEELSHNENNCEDRHAAAESSKGQVGAELSNMVARGNGISNEGYREDITCDEMDVDPSSICISPPGLHSVDEVVCSSVFSESRRKSLLNTETEDLPPTDDALTDSTEFEDDILNRNSQENVMDEDIDIPSSTMEFVEQCTVHPDDHHSHDIRPTAVCKTSAAVPVEPQVVDLAETSGVIIETERMEVESKDRMEFVEQCKVTHRNHLHSHDIEPTVICKTSDDDTVDSKTSPSVSGPMESPVVEEVAEAAGVITESDRMEIQSNNESTSHHSSSAGNATAVEGGRDNLVYDCSCIQKPDADGNMMVVHSDSLLKCCSSTSSCNEEQLSVEHGETETGSSEKPSSPTEPHFTRSELQKGDESNNSGNEVINQPVVSGINVTSGEGNNSQETAEAF